MTLMYINFIVVIDVIYAWIGIYGSFLSFSHYLMEHFVSLVLHFDVQNVAD